MTEVESESRGAGPLRTDPLARLTIEQLRRRTSMKWREYPEDVLPLWVAEMDVPLAPPIVDALHRAIALGDTGYPHGTAYAEAFAEFAAERWGWDGLRAEHTMLVPDVMRGIVEVLRIVTDPGDAVVVCPPVYPPYYAFLERAGRIVVEAPLGADLRTEFDVLEEAFVRARSHGRRPAFLMTNPHNPTGVVHTREELGRMAALAREHGVRVIADEIHGPLVLPGAAPFTPYLTVAGAEDAFTVTSASKAWNLAGLKCALAVAGPEATAELQRMPEEVFADGPSHLGAIAHVAAFSDGGQWLDELLVGLDANRRLLGYLIAEQLPAARYLPPEGTYLAWLDCTRLGLPDSTGTSPGSVDPAAFFLERAKVALNSGRAFGTGGDGFVRINFATNPEILGQALESMGRAVEDLCL